MTFERFYHDELLSMLADAREAGRLASQAVRQKLAPPWTAYGSYHTALTHAETQILQAMENLRQAHEIVTDQLDMITRGSL